MYVTLLLIANFSTGNRDRTEILKSVANSVIRAVSFRSLAIRVTFAETLASVVRGPQKSMRLQNLDGDLVARCASHRERSR